MKNLDLKFDKAAIGKRLAQSAEFVFPGRGCKTRLAKALLMKPGAFQKYYTGTTMPGAEILHRLTELGVNINWILTGIGFPLEFIMYEGNTRIPMDTCITMPGLLDHVEGCIIRQYEDDLHNEIDQLIQSGNHQEACLVVAIKRLLFQFATPSEIVIDAKRHGLSPDEYLEMSIIGRRELGKRGPNLLVNGYKLIGDRYVSGLRLIKKLREFYH